MSILNSEVIIGSKFQDVCGSTDSSSMVREPKPIQLVSKELQTLFMSKRSMDTWLQQQQQNDFFSSFLDR